VGFEHPLQSVYLFGGVAFLNRLLARRQAFKFGQHLKEVLERSARAERDGGARASTSGTAPIVVVANNVGVFTLNSTGSGDAVATLPATNTFVSPSNAPNPGEIVTFWATGLGAVSGDESQPAQRRLGDVSVTLGQNPSGGVPPVTWGFWKRAVGPGSRQWGWTRGRFGRRFRAYDVTRRSSLAKPKAASAPSDTQELYEKLVATNPKVERKGATVPYTSLNGHMFSYLSKEGKLALRLPPADREAFLKKYRAKLCEAYGVVQPEYIEVPDALLASTHELRKFFDAGYDYVASLKPKPTKRRGGRGFLLPRGRAERRLARRPESVHVVGGKQTRG